MCNPDPIAKGVKKASMHDESQLRSFLFREPPMTVVAPVPDEKLIVAHPLDWDAPEK